VCVCHLRNFDWPVKKAWMLPHLAHLTSVTQNCTSFLNSPGIAKIAFGIILCILATLSIEAGKILAVGKHFGIIERVDSPFFFWLVVALYLSVALFAAWKGMKLFTQPTLPPIVASLPYPPISKPIAFLGLAFIGAIWGSIASGMFGSLLGGVLALFASVALVGAWYTVILNRKKQLSSLLFVLLSLLSGFGCIYALNFSIRVS
jgi:hypothetical protein